MPNPATTEDTTGYTDEELNKIEPWHAMKRFCSRPQHEPSAAHGKVGVVHRSWIVTSPNTSDVPALIWGKTEVRLRKDARFGPDDFTLWPQWHRDPVPYLSCVPRKWFPNAPASSKPLAPLWWTPTHADIKLPGSTLSNEIGLIKAAEMDAMEKLKGRLVEDAESVLKKLDEDLGMGAVLPTLLPGLGANLSFMRHAWIWLTDTAGTLEEKRMELVDFQRSFLEVKGMVNYFTWKTRRWDRALDPMPEEPEWVHGCFVEDKQTAGMLWRMGVPVWLVRDKISVLRSGIHIERPGTGFLQPNDYEGENIVLEIDESFPLVYHDTPRSIAHYLAMQRFSRVRSVAEHRTPRGNVLADVGRLGDVIGGANTARIALAELRAQRAASAGDVAAAPTGSTSALPMGSAATRGVRGGQARSRPYSARGGRRIKDADAPALIQPSGVFADAWVDGQPDLLAPWPKALSRMNTLIPRGDQKPKLYTFPTPAIFFKQTGAPNHDFMRNWLHIRPTWLSKVRRVGEGAPQLSTQTWRTVLQYGFGTPKPELIKPGSDVDKELHKGLALCGMTPIGDGTIRFRDGDRLATRPGRITGPRSMSEVTFDGDVYDLRVTHAADYRELVRMAVWELHELNFRYDLQLLDAVCTSLGDSAMSLVDRQDRLKAYWGLEDQLGYDPTTTFISQFNPFPEREGDYGANQGVWRGDKEKRARRNRGIGSVDCAERLPPLRALFDVYATWTLRGPLKLEDIRRTDLSRGEIEDLEELLANTIVQVFYDCFRRAIVVPRRMWPVA